jgi:putative transposase
VVAQTFHPPVNSKRDKETFSAVNHHRFPAPSRCDAHFSGVQKQCDLSIRQHVIARARRYAMSRLFHPLLLLIANSTEHRLARHVQYLSEELAILRARIPGEIHTTREERARLFKFGKPLGRDIDRLIQIVTPGTFHRWVREEKRGYVAKQPGRPRKRQVLRELVRKIAYETGMGYRRILGELRRLGINRICRQTVRNILKEKGVEPSPKRSRGTWDQFLAMHAKTL